MTNNTASVFVLVLFLLLFGIIIGFAIWSQYERFKLVDKSIKSKNVVVASELLAPDIIGALKSR